MSDPLIWYQLMNLTSMRCLLTAGPSTIADNLQSCGACLDSAHHILSLELNLYKVTLIGRESTFYFITRASAML